MKDIIVGVDGSPGSEDALDRALLEAERTGQPLRVVHAWTLPTWAGGGGVAYTMPLPNPAESGRCAQENLDEIVEKALMRRTSAAAVTVTAEAHEGPASKVLSRLSTDAALLIVGGSGHGQLASTLLGSATTYLLHHARCPVMVVPAGAQTTRFARVVVGLDGSPSSQAAFRWSLGVARTLDCPLVAVHAWVISTPPVPIPYTSLPPKATYEQDAHDWLNGELLGLLEGEEQTTVVRHVPYGHTSAALLDETGPDDLLVIGSRGRGGFASLLLGSVATQCAMHATSTVVVLKEQTS
jgi:nucleotide-binding universal stress UspA family protein